MALPGFEILYSSIVSSVKSLDDAAIAVVHWHIISSGLKCCGSGENWSTSVDGQLAGSRYDGSELLPSDWNSDSTVYCLRYIDPTSDRKFLMKAVAMDGTLVLHLVRCFDEKTLSSSIRSRDFVNDQFSSYATAYTNLEEFNSQLTKELNYKNMDKDATGSSSKAKESKSSTSSASSPSPSHPQPGRSDRPPGGIGYIPPRRPFGASPLDPLAVGRADLDPLAGGVGGGMFMDPSRFPSPGRFGPGGHFVGPTPPGFPPGSVPPGARFDPIGPPGIRPNPDPDHERPPGYDDMFM